SRAAAIRRRVGSPSARAEPATAPSRADSGNTARIRSAWGRSRQRSSHTSSATAVILTLVDTLDLAADAARLVDGGGNTDEPGLRAPLVDRDDARLDQFEACEVRGD